MHNTLQKIETEWNLENLLKVKQNNYRTYHSPGKSAQNVLVERSATLESRRANPTCQLESGCNDPFQYLCKALMPLITSSAYYFLCFVYGKPMTNELCSWIHFVCENIVH